MSNAPKRAQPLPQPGVQPRSGTRQGTRPRTRPRGAWAGPALLTVLVAFQAVSGIAGGALLVLDPSGAILGLPLTVLRRGPFTDFLIPGWILLLVLGVLPAVTATALWVRPRLRAAAPLERVFGEHWSWIAAGVVGVGLLLWLAVELLLVGPSSLLVVYAAVGVAILVAALLPGTRRFYRTDPRPRTVGRRSIS